MNNILLMQVHNRLAYISSEQPYLFFRKMFFSIPLIFNKLKKPLNKITKGMLLHVDPHSQRVP